MLRVQIFWDRFNTVWGLKSAGKAAPELEFYFYDYARTNRSIPLDDSVSAVADLFAQDFSVLQVVAFFTASVEVPMTRAAPKIDEIDLYTDGIGGALLQNSDRRGFISRIRVVRRGE
jgi:hypothetical protein